MWLRGIFFVDVPASPPYHFSFCLLASPPFLSVWIYIKAIGWLCRPFRSVPVFHGLSISVEYV